MGHRRIGRLPKTLNCQRVVGLLDHAPVDTAAVAAATVTAAEGRLRVLAHDPSLTYCLWLLTRLTWGGRDDRFTDTVVGLALDVEASDSELSFIAQVTDRRRPSARCRAPHGRRRMSPPPHRSAPRPTKTSRRELS